MWQCGGRRAYGAGAFRKLRLNPFRPLEHAPAIISTRHHLVNELPLFPADIAGMHATGRSIHGDSPGVTKTERPDFRFCVGMTEEWVVFRNAIGLAVCRRAGEVVLRSRLRWGTAMESSSG